MQGKRLFAAAAVAMLMITACGKSVEGTYESMAGVRVELKSGGKALVSTAMGTDTCAWSQSGKQVTLNCQNDPMTFTVDDDGSLNGPPTSFLARLSKKK
jgi:hypothetical protein